MSNLWFIADAHLGHRAIAKYRDGVCSMEDNTKFITEYWKEHVKKKRDVVWCLGDMAFDSEHNKIIQELPGRKILIRGNHDNVPIEELNETYEDIHGIISRYKMWMSHAPIHPAELYDKINLHGHVHEKTIISERYINLCVDALMLNLGTPMVNLEQLSRYVQKVKDGDIKYGEHKSFTR